MQKIISRLDTCTSVLNLIAVGWFQTIYIYIYHQRTGKQDICYTRPNCVPADIDVPQTSFLTMNVLLPTACLCLCSRMHTDPACQPPTIEYVPLLDQSIAHNAIKCTCIAPKNISYGELSTRAFMNPNSCSASSFPE